MSTDYPGGRRKDGGVEVVSSLGGLFDCAEDGEGEAYEHEFDEQELQICDQTYRIRQFRWHEANANQVWPGTFALAEYMSENIGRYNNGLMLELGAATGALALHLCALGCSVITSDIVDDGVVEENIKYNFQHNNQEVVQHVPHTWGEMWPQDQVPSSSLHKIIASDILLYVKAYPALVETLTYLFDAGKVTEFLMSWNRRLSTTPIYFQLMEKAGFSVENLPHCLYRFTKNIENKKVVN